MPAPVVAEEDPERADVRALVQVHRAWSLQQTPHEFTHSVPADAVARSGVTLFGARSGDGTLLGVAGLKRLDDQHYEVKTMHTAAAARGAGVGRTLLAALLAEARRRGATRVSLETGTGEPFAAARALYGSFGFEPCEAFGGYSLTAHNTCLTLRLS